jgi:hypothetical protein
MLHATRKHLLVCRSVSNLAHKRWQGRSRRSRVVVGGARCDIRTVLSHIVRWIVTRPLFCACFFLPVLTFLMSHSFVIIESKSGAAAGQFIVDATDKNAKPVNIIDRSQFADDHMCHIDFWKRSAGVLWIDWFVCHFAVCVHVYWF